MPLKTWNWLGDFNFRPTPNFGVRCAFDDGSSFIVLSRYTQYNFSHEQVQIQWKNFSCSCFLWGKGNPRVFVNNQINIFRTWAEID